MTVKRLLAYLVFVALVSSTAAQSLITKNLTWDGNTREYAIYIPASYDGTSDFPLLFNFHGGGDFIASYMPSVDMRPIADTANFILVYPQAIPDAGNGGSTSWMHKSPTTHDDVPFVGAMIDAIVADYRIDTDRVYACGYSLGGEFTYALACQVNDRIAAIGTVARTMGAETFNTCSPVHPTGVLTILGTDDSISDYNGVWYLGVQYYMSADEMHAYWVNYSQCESTPTITSVPDTDPSDGSRVERYTWATSEGCTYVEHLKVEGGGHDWPGSYGNRDIDASQEIWNFVSRYNLNGLIGCRPTSSDNLHDAHHPLNVLVNSEAKQLNIETDFRRGQSYEIYSLDGELMTTGQLTADLTLIDISQLTPRIYVLTTGNLSYKFILAR